MSLFFFSSRRRHTRSLRDWSSDVCSSDLGIDVKAPGMLVAVIARSPVFGGKVQSFDAAKAKAVPGVKHVVQISTGVAIVADGYWSAKKGRDALTVTWDEGPTASVSSASISQLFA